MGNTVINGPNKQKKKQNQIIHLFARFESEMIYSFDTVQSGFCQSRRKRQWVGLYLWPGCQGTNFTKLHFCQKRFG
jgi:hypothetical protein